MVSRRQDRRFAFSWRRDAGEVFRLPCSDVPGWTLRCFRRLYHESCIAIVAGAVILAFFSKRRARCGSSFATAATSAGIYFELMLGALLMDSRSPPKAATQHFGSAADWSPHRVARAGRGCAFGTSEACGDAFHHQGKVTPAPDFASEPLDVVALGPGEGPLRSAAAIELRRLHRCSRLRLPATNFAPSALRREGTNHRLKLLARTAAEGQGSAGFALPFPASWTLWHTTRHRLAERAGRNALLAPPPL